MRQKEVWPSFLVIGAGKSGTTSLQNYLEQHPDVFMSAVKEPNFFGLEDKTIDDFSYSEEAKAFFKNSVTNLDDYLALFVDASKARAVGEISNTYLYHESACKKIKHYLPGVKLIAIFRQPTERLYSRYLHLARENRLPTPTFDACLDTESIWWKRPDLIQEGFYYKHLSKFYSEFDSNQIKVLLYEELQKDPRKLMESLYHFIGVDDSFNPDLTIKLNSSGFVKNKFVNQLVGGKGLVARAGKSILPEKAISMLKNKRVIQKKLNKVREKNLVKPELDLELKNQVTRVYEDDIKQLADLIKRDLSHWLPQ
ncbi:MAG: sulfotransferase [Ekhidna sp.]